MLLVASREIRTNISLGIYEARYDRKIARMVAPSILVEGGWGKDKGRNFERLLVRASVVELGGVMVPRRYYKLTNLIAR